MKPIASTNISLGLINLPVGICKATGALEDVAFKLGDPKGGAVTQQYVDSAGNVIPRDRQTKVIDGKVIDKDSLDAITELTKIKTLTVEDIVDRADFIAEGHRITGFYYLQNTKKGGNPAAYKLFTDALAKIDGVAITKFTLRTRQQQIAIWPNAEGILCASTLNFSSDTREPDENVKMHLEATYSEAEMNMAVQLLTALKGNGFNTLHTATDEAVTLRKELVEKALAGEKIEKPKDAPQAEKNAALADALAASLAAIKTAA